jgi:2-oxoglutarate dehydrogenase E1 component
MKREFKKPLIIMSPKSLLRHRECVSKVESFTDDEFWSILDDEIVDRKTAKRIIFCSGKLYYDLAAHREESKVKDTSIIRIEQLYPLNTDLLERIVGTTRMYKASYGAKRSQRTWAAGALSLHG